MSSIFNSTLFSEGNALRRQLSDALFTREMKFSEELTDENETLTAKSLYSTMQNDAAALLQEIEANKMLETFCKQHFQNHLKRHPVPSGMKLSHKMIVTGLRAEIQRCGIEAGVNIDAYPLSSVRNIRLAIDAISEAKDASLILFIQNLLAIDLPQTRIFTDICQENTSNKEKATGIRQLLSENKREMRRVNEISLIAGTNGVARMRAIPREIYYFHLTKLKLQGHDLRTLPDLPQHWDLDSVKLAYNNISHLPHSFENLRPVSLELQGNSISSLPKFNTNRLKRIGANDTLFEHIVKSQNLRRLWRITLIGTNFSDELLHKIHYGFYLIGKKQNSDTSDPLYGRRQFDQVVQGPRHHPQEIIFQGEATLGFNAGIREAKKAFATK